MQKGTRRRSRELALKLIYCFPEGEFDVRLLLDSFWANFRFADDVLGEPLDNVEMPLPVEVARYTEGLVIGVAQNLAQIDQTIGQHSTNWALQRIAQVDLSILRLAAFELLYRPDVPASVAINEAIELGKQYGTKESPAFINGILDKISRQHRAPEK